MNDVNYLYSFLSYIFIFLVIMGIIIKNRNQYIEENRRKEYNDLLKSLIIKTGKDMEEIFMIAQKEKGFNFTKTQISNHIFIYISKNILPTYMEDFLDDGRDYL